jgi:hypothetical protein
MSATADYRPVALAAGAAAFVAKEDLVLDLPAVLSMQRRPAATAPAAAA